MSDIKFKIQYFKENLDWKKDFTTDYGKMDKETKDKLLYGEWKMEPVRLLVLYSKGKKHTWQHLYGKDNVHYVNTSCMDVQDIIRGHRYKDVLIADDGVKQEDIDIAMKRKVDSNE